MRSFASVLALLIAACASAQVADANSANPAPPTSSSSIGSSDPSHPDRSCAVDADCAVKNVGSCCGDFPKCVNVNATADPAAVRAQCAQQHRMGVCMIPKTVGCSCVKGQCADINAAETKRPR